MEAIKLNEDVIPLSKFRSSISSSIKRINETQRPMLLTQNSKPAAVVISVDEFEAIRDRLELVEDIKIARNNIADGKVYSVDEAKDFVTKRLI